MIRRDWITTMERLELTGLAFIEANVELRSIEDRDAAAKAAETRWHERAGVPQPSRGTLGAGAAVAFPDDAAGFAARLTESIDRTRLNDIYFESTSADELREAPPLRRLRLRCPRQPMATPLEILALEMRCAASELGLIESCNRPAINSDQALSAWAQLQLVKALDYGDEVQRMIDQGSLRMTTPRPPLRWSAKS
ncbi:MAG: hypothetical protein ACHQ01_04425 [Candidatus Limnocylindrales bacterium]